MNRDKGKRVETMWWKKKVSEVSTSEDDLDSSGGDSDDEEEEQDNEGPTLVTVDDGKGGVKHIKVSFWQ